ncbi:hypothetical protein OEZ85_000609 [Tetradesmus obliquus]|uniref:Uncharacterized protein n=1 Tax=Tetradesmus obliquus TaxID=3088 RepID=A0ABY8UP43_TETOB|nr:hypothetical protein OEZ85_000609 [Tetradesmus obliquus]
MCCQADPTAPDMHMTPHALHAGLEPEASAFLACPQQTLRFGAGGIGFPGLSTADTYVLPPDPTIAVGPDTALHVVNSLVAIYKVNPGTGNPASLNSTKPALLVSLPSFFTLVAPQCSGGYFSPSATYDKLVGRFLLTAVCGGDANQILLAVSSTSSALGGWLLYSFAAEATQSTPMVCDGYPAALHTQVSYNTDGVFISYVQNCPDDPFSATGAVLYALPKWAAYRGATYFWVPVWTAYDVQKAAGYHGNLQDYAPMAFVQMQPVHPQREADVAAEVAYFVTDLIAYWTDYAQYEEQGAERTELALSALINTGSLWLYEGPHSQSPSPLLVTRIIPRGTSCLIKPQETQLQQPGQCGTLHAGAARPPGFWDGGAVLYADRIYLADRGPDRLNAYQQLQPTIWSQAYYENNMNIDIQPSVNPCKYYSNWAADNTITFGAVVSNSGVLDFAARAKSDPVGLAFPQVAVRGNNMLITYSYAGIRYLPDGSGTPAYPGVAYSTIPISSGSSSSAAAAAAPAFNLIKPGASCVTQGGSQLWGAYAGIDTHYPSYRIWSAVEMAVTKGNSSGEPNSGVWISVL